MIQPRVAIVVAEFNSDITSALLSGALDYFLENDIHVSEQSVVHVPGAVELPIAAQRCALTEKFDVIIVFAAIVKGETDHYDYVSQSVTHGCQQAALKQNIPIIFGVLTTPTRVQALDRVGGARGHHGREAASSALKTWCALQRIESI